jgi:hypothetical protein
MLFPRIFTNLFSFPLSHLTRRIRSRLLYCIFTLHLHIIACAYNSNMSSPSRRNSDDLLVDTGPPRSVLQQLLEEINGTDSPPTTPRPSPPPTYVPESVNHTASVWCGGGSMAQDVRAKLRVMDEARQRKMSISSTDFTPEDPAALALRRPSTQLSSLSFATGTGVWRSQSYSSKTIQGDAFADSSSSSADSFTFPTSGSHGSSSRMCLDSEHLQS